MPMMPMYSWCFSCPCQDSEPKGFMDKLYAIQDVFISVQNALDEVASFGERVKKYVFWVNKFPLWFLFAAVCCEAVRCDLWFFTYIQLNVFFYEALLCLSFSTRSTFNWTVPFLSWLAITALCLATFLLYLIPLRYLVLAWGESWFHNTQTTTQIEKKMLRYVGGELVHEKGSFSYIFVRLQIIYLKIMKYGPGFRGMRSLPF